MLVLKCNIQITGAKIIKFDYVSHVEVATSMKTITDTAKLTLPRNLKFHDRNLLDYIKRGDKITIDLGYEDSGLQTVFKGYITNVSTGRPITIECEDEAWMLKQKTVKNLYYEKFSLKAFISEHLPEITDKTIADIELGELRINGEVTVAKVFEYLRKNYGINLFFKNGTLQGLMQFSEISDSKTVTFTYGRNIITDNLKYTLAEDVKIAVIAKCITKENKILSVTEPADAKDKGSEYEMRTFFFPDAHDESQLREYAKQKIKDFKVDKMEGTITAFGIPFVRCGDVVLIKDELHPERDGKKFNVDAVTYSFGTQSNGYRQKINLGTEIH